MSNNIQNQPLNQPQNMGFYQQPQQDDEIDLRELIKVIWDYKWLTVIMCAIAIAGSAFYALNQQEWWVAKGKVIEPQLNDVASLYAQSKNVASILKSNSSNSSNILNDLFEPKTLLNTFVNLFNSSLNKRTFLEKNPEFISYLKENKIQKPGNELTVENQLLRNKYRLTLSNWTKEISAKKPKKPKVIDLSFKATSQISSAELLNAYINYISDEVKNNQVEKFELFLKSSKKDLTIAIAMAEKNAQAKLDYQIKKTEYAYTIASKGGLANYQSSFDDKEQIFQINMGSKALKVQMQVLKSIKDVSLLDPKISQQKIILETLNNLKVSEGGKFSPFRYLEVVEPPLARAAPKRALIVVLATLLAGMLSIFIALVHHFMTKKED